MTWKNVTSSNLRAYRYDKAAMALDIQFKNGSVYRYANVPMNIATKLETADSVGQYFSGNIKNTYDAEKLS